MAGELSEAVQRDVTACGGRGVHEGLTTAFVSTRSALRQAAGSRSPFLLMAHYVGCGGGMCRTRPGTRPDVVYFFHMHELVLELVSPYRGWDEFPEFARGAFLSRPAHEFPEFPEFAVSAVLGTYDAWHTP